MADIIQAARWLKEGKRVRLKGWFPGTYYICEPVKIKLRYTDDSNLYSDIELLPSDLLSEEWEIFNAE